jgi:hypothetical protein
MRYISLTLHLDWVGILPTPFPLIESVLSWTESYFIHRHRTKVNNPRYMIAVLLNNERTGFIGLEQWN